MKICINTSTETSQSQPTFVLQFIFAPHFPSLNKHSFVSALLSSHATFTFENKCIHMKMEGEKKKIEQEENK
ncbi:CLUMA_CG000898, isoform A [Clunio marinus]|uniref:CLUMA_CG000898, isoform A n=1 Tax=Clunio marinus TaxID=568069 RepID=A0A1J1HG81_9DIPT|nr:CLUMA_CG000898, isoform A [Clunio marinus]